MDFLARLFKRDHAASDEEQATRRPFEEDMPSTDATGRRGTMVSERDQLATFRFLVGISSSASSGSKQRRHAGGRAAVNMGIYARVIKNEQAAGSSYRTYAILINGSLGLQLIVAAALTALGAAGSDHTLVTILGSINTVIAGFLTFLKGSGLPNRLKYYQNEWSKVREYIEQRERDFSREGCRLDLYKVMTAIEQMYEEVKADVQANTPDGYVSVNQLRNLAGSKTSPSVPASALTAENDDDHGTGFTDRLKGLEAKYGDNIKRFTNVGEEVREAERDIDEYGRKTVEEKVIQANEEVAAYAEQRMSEVAIEHAGYSTATGISGSIQQQQL